jgi:hypothetical protein
MRQERMTVDPSMTETVVGTLRNCGSLETLLSYGDVWALSRNKCDVNGCKCQKSHASQGFREEMLNFTLGGRRLNSK